MTRARLTTEREREYELVQFTEHAEWVLRDDANDIRVFGQSSPRERVEVRCDFCGRWSVDAAPADEGDGWKCFGGDGECPTDGAV